MNQDEFNGLDRLEQIEHVNNQLEGNESLTYICKNVSIIRDRFKNVNYNYLGDRNKYIHESNVKSNINNINIIQLDVVKEVINKSDKHIKDNLLDIISNYDMLNVLKEIIELHECNKYVTKQQILIDLEDSDSKPLFLVPIVKD
ncbi:TPA: hypothetical protein PPO51_002470 [Clostridioides difficile]|nr:hypothetical protein [Clostridioides difficile]HDJ1470946.1 hypothetical protein [Clostridioides difficile]